MPGWSHLERTLNGQPEPPSLWTRFWGWFWASGQNLDMNPFFDALAEDRRKQQLAKPKPTGQAALMANLDALIAQLQLRTQTPEPLPVEPLPKILCAFCGAESETVKCEGCGAKRKEAARAVCH